MDAGAHRFVQQFQLRVGPMSNINGRKIDIGPGFAAYFHRETMGADKSSELRPGTLDLHVLKGLCPRRMLGYRTAQHLKTISKDVLQVGESSLYPVLQRALLNQSKV